MGGLITQFFPPKLTFTEENTPSLVGKVFIVTGGKSGIGLELVKILYSKGGTVYVAARFPDKTAAAIEIEAIKSICPGSAGQIKSLHLDLSDLTTISTCANSFLDQESRLDVLSNNAGMGAGAPIGSTSVQGHELLIGVNCLGPYLLTKLLLPILRRTAEASPKGSVRVVFTCSGTIDMVGPHGGLSLAELEPGNYNTDMTYNYSASKAGNWFLASEFDKLTRKDGILCIVQSPGTLKTKGWGKISWPLRMLFAPVLHDPKMGAYTELWCGISPEVKIDDGGRLAIPWGRWHPSPRKDILESLKTKEEGGTGLAGEFWVWCEEQTKAFAGR